MLSRVLIGLGLSTAVAAVAVTAARQRFVARLDGLERHLVASAGEARVREDLPPPVRALAHRLGAERQATACFVALSQSGTMRPAPTAAERPFAARQTLSVAQPGFVWRATFAPLGLLLVADYFVAGEGGVDGRVLGALPLVRVVGGELAAKGEVMRYLAELPWVPDAILTNRALDWRVLDERTLAVAAGAGRARGEVILRLDEDGLVAAVAAPDRPRSEGRALVERPWRGRFSDYRHWGDRLIPTRAEVAWVLGDEDFTYWRCVVSSWTAR